MYVSIKSWANTMLLFLSITITPINSILNVSILNYIYYSVLLGEVKRKDNTYPDERVAVRFVTLRLILGAVAVNSLPKTGKMIYDIDIYMDSHAISDEN